MLAVDPFRQLVEELWSASAPAARCPHLGHDAAGCVCRSPACPDDGRRLVVDYASLQLWCLDGPEHHPRCIFYAADVQAVEAAADADAPANG